MLQLNLDNIFIILSLICLADVIALFICLGLMYEFDNKFTHKIFNYLLIIGIILTTIMTIIYVIK